MKARYIEVFEVTISRTVKILFSLQVRRLAYDLKGFFGGWDSILLATL